MTHGSDTYGGLTAVSSGSPQHERGDTAHLPATRQPAADAVESVRFDRAPAFAGDLVRSLDEASSAVSALADQGGASDVTVSALTALVCAGTTVADALQAAADVARKSPGLEPHGLALARVPGPVEGVWEYQITMTVSARDPLTGEFCAPTHHADRPR
ncbi:hypothetical protein [Streptomyces chartreusis]|uniref:hypothetical protein n=1 Tax=Streptomyces chartreusis TaxID=1969 RepID=UPI003D74B11A